MINMYSTKVSFVFRFVVIVMLLANGPGTLKAQTSVCTNHVQNNSSSMVTFNVQNTNAFGVIITSLSCPVGTTAQTVQILYNPTAINSTGATWSQGIIGAGQNGWISAFSGS